MPQELSLDRCKRGRFIPSLHKPPDASSLGFTFAACALTISWLPTWYGKGLCCAYGKETRLQEDLKMQIRFAEPFLLFSITVFLGCSGCSGGTPQATEQRRLESNHGRARAVKCWATETQRSDLGSNFPRLHICSARQLSAQYYCAVPHCARMTSTLLASVTGCSWDTRCPILAICAWKH